MRRLVAVSALLLVACGREQPSTLTATSTSPTDVSLVWEAEPGAAGQVVEYANAPDDAYTVPEFVPPSDGHDGAAPVSGPSGARPVRRTSRWPRGSTRTCGPSG